MNIMIFFFPNPGSYLIYQASTQFNDHFGYTVYFQLNTNPSDFHNVANSLINNIIQKLCPTIQYDPTNASLSLYEIIVWVLVDANLIIPLGKISRGM